MIYDEGQCRPSKKHNQPFCTVREIGELLNKIDSDASIPKNWRRLVWDRLKDFTVLFEKEQVYKEPVSGVGTRTVLMTDQVHLWEIEYQPYESSEVHTHNFPYAFLIVEGGHLEVFDEKGSYVDDLRVAAGDYRLFDVRDGSLYLPNGSDKLISATHSVRNTTSYRYREVLVEFLDLQY